MKDLERMEKASGVPVAFLLKSLLFSYIFLLYKLQLGEKAVNMAIIVIYVAATALGGFLAGKRMKSRRFLWGLLLGGAYFLILTAVSLIVGKGNIQMGSSFFTTLVLCAGGGMLGGMLS